MKRFDLIILGAGAAGFAAAMKANEFHIKTLMVNNNAIGIGGTCVNVGCLPTKHLLYIAELIYKAKNNNIKGLNTSISFDFKKIIEEKDKLVKKLRYKKYEEVLKELSYVKFISGNAKFTSKNEIQIGKEIYSANKFIIATGSSTLVPEIEGINRVDYLTNIKALQLKGLPKTMIVLGGGPLGIEFSQMFSMFGTKVCLLQHANRIVPREEPELAAFLKEYLQNEGIEICTNIEIKSVIQKGKEKIVKGIVSGNIKRFNGEELLIAIGRRPNTSNLGLGKLGIRLGKKGEVIVNDEMQADGNIWAAGDVTGEPMLETVAAKEGMIASNNALSKSKKKMDYSIVPHAVFTDPNLAGVGLTDEQAIEKGIKCRCNVVSMEAIPKAQAVKDARGAIKIVINNKTNEIIGIHILAHQAADLIHEGVMIIKNRMIVDDVIDTLHIFPTLSEAIKIAAQSFRRDITKMSCCVE